MKTEARIQAILFILNAASDFMTSRQITNLLKEPKSPSEALSVGTLLRVMYLLNVVERKLIYKAGKNERYAYKRKTV